jgi:hypothetical protein
MLIAAALPVSSQTVPAATQSSTRFFLGAGASAYHDDFDGAGHMEGGAFWFDAYPNRGPAFLHGLGFELEGRDISMGPPPSQPSNLREDTAGGGAIYSWRRFHSFNPYGKFMWEHASIDFHVGVPNYNHDTRSLYEGGAGFDLRLVRNVWLRAGFEEQFWQHLFGSGPLAMDIRPRGVTLGVSYSFNHVHLK